MRVTESAFVFCVLMFSTHTVLFLLTCSDCCVVFAAYQRARKPNGDAIANMALDNFTEMMAKTADKRFLLEKAIEIELARRFPTQYVSRYALVTHSLVPYEDCRQIGAIEEKILHELSEGKTSVEQVDYKVAQRLIEQQLTPYLRARGITPASFVYNSLYYPKEMPARAGSAKL